MAADEINSPSGPDGEPSSEPLKKLAPFGWCKVVVRRWSGLSTANKIAVAVPLLAAIMAGCFGIVNVLLPETIKGATEDPALSLVDATVRDLENEAATVDVKVRSQAPQASFAKRAAIIIEDARHIEFCEAPYPQDSTYTYDIALPLKPKKFPTTITEDISQVIPPNGADRFSLRIGTDGGSLGGGQYICSECSFTTMKVAKISLRVRHCLRTFRGKVGREVLHGWIRQNSESA
ncbi:hypothetical protein [Actinoplanes sp. RD1]|uniref:hypothetical protein n=1 Tax=Actinoplanes sp. RD1 TaxID=3064538 RepID=UPI0027423525|nr:hypothetical protein [Actinoplanes sp. RD1]